MSEEKKITIHIDSSEQDPKIPDRTPAACPNCSAGPEKWEMGFGLAGGGYGPYQYCGSCGTMLSKTQEE
jgi:hypothetical protein